MKPVSIKVLAGFFCIQTIHPLPLITLTEMFPSVRTRMTIQNIPDSFQSILLLHCESTASLIAGVRHGTVRGKCLAVRIARKLYLQNMSSKNEFITGNPETVVITSAETLKAAFRLWAEEQEKERIMAKEEAMLDESVVQQRLRKSRATLWRWNTTGYLICYKIGGKNCYKESDVERIEKGTVR